MADFKQGVKYYTKGYTNIVVSFPENDICCRWCKFCRNESNLNRSWCRLTEDIIYNPEYGIGDNCPIEFNKEE